MDATNLVCNWCGDFVSPGFDMCSRLECTRCDSSVYHQWCIEACLRQQKLPVDRMTGFSCPRGFGKYMPDGGPCKGKIDCTHRLVFKKKKGMVAPPSTAVVASHVKKPAVVHNARKTTTNAAATNVVAAKYEPGVGVADRLGLSVAKSGSNLIINAVVGADDEGKGKGKGKGKGELVRRNKVVALPLPLPLPLPREQELQQHDGRSSLFDSIKRRGQAATSYEEIDDDVLMHAIKFGMAAAGLGPQHYAYVESVRKLMIIPPPEQQQHLVVDADADADADADVDAGVVNIDELLVLCGILSV